jgi:hypothetical protein
MDRINNKNQKAVAHAARAPQLFGFYIKYLYDIRTNSSLESKSGNSWLFLVFSVARQNHSSSRRIVNCQKILNINDL